jgi:hypothetical protein
MANLGSDDYLSSLMHLEGRNRTHAGRDIRANTRRSVRRSPDEANAPPSKSFDTWVKNSVLHACPPFETHRKPAWKAGNGSNRDGMETADNRAGAAVQIISRPWR